MRATIAVMAVLVLAGIALAAPAPELTRLTLRSKVVGRTTTDIVIDETGYSSGRSATWGGRAVSPSNVAPILSGRTVVGYRVTWRVSGTRGKLIHTARYRYKAGSLSLHIVVP